MEETCRLEWVSKGNKAGKWAGKWSAGKMIDKCGGSLVVGELKEGTVGLPSFGQARESMKGMEVNVSVGLLSFPMWVLGALLWGGLGGLYFYLNNFTVSIIHYSIPSNSRAFRTAVLIKNLKNFFLKRLARLSFIEFIPFEKEFLRSKVA